MTLNVTTIGGGTGTYNVLLALKKMSGLHISSIISMSDDGGSTGKLRDEYGVLPPGDLRRGVVALSDDDKAGLLRKVFNYRFEGGLLDGHNLGNLILMALVDITGDYGKAIDGLEEILDLKGKVYPVTFEQTRLVAKLETGKYVFGESNIDIPKHDGNLRIRDFYVIKEKYYGMVKTLLSDNIGIDNQLFKNLLDHIIKDIPNENPAIPKVLGQSDYIIVGPGDLYTSILSNVMIGNIKDYMLQSNAKKILLLNLFTKFGETTAFKLSDYISVLDRYFGKDIFDYILVQDFEKFPISFDILSSYKKENKEMMLTDFDDPRIIKSDFIKLSDMARHDPDKLAIVLGNLIK